MLRTRSGANRRGDQPDRSIHVFGLCMRDRELLVLPRPRRVRHHDLQRREVGRDRVDVDRARQLELHVPAAGHARAETGRAGVHRHRDPERGRGLVDRVHRAVVGPEPLRGRMQLQAAQAELAHRALELGDRGVTLERVDRRVPEERVGMIARATRDEVVGDRRQPGVGLRVPREQHAEHVGGAEHVGHLRDVVVRQRRAEVRLAGGPELAERAVDVLRRRRMDVNVDRAHATNDQLSTRFGPCRIDLCGR